MATPFQAWHAEALRLADQCEETALHYWQAIGDEHADALRALQEARAALSAHLLAVPIGHAVAVERDRAARVCDDEARIRVEAGDKHPEDRASRSRCYAAARAAINCAKGVRNGEIVP